jgi:mercuric ion binding protein
MLKTLWVAITLALLWNPAWAAPPVYHIHVDGLACPFCAYGIEKSLSQQAGVKEVETDIQAGLIRVLMAEGASLSEEQARQAVEAAGFSLRSFNETAEGH